MRLFLLALLPMFFLTSCAIDGGGDPLDGPGGAPPAAGGGSSSIGVDVSSDF